MENNARERKKTPPKTNMTIKKQANLVNNCRGSTDQLGLSAMIMMKCKFKINYTVLVVIVACILSLTGDSIMSWSSPITPKLMSNKSRRNPLGRAATHEEISWIGSLVTLGAMIGPVPGGLAADHFGRKPTLMFMAVPHIISLVTLAFARSIRMYYFARVLGGISSGAVYAVMPMYIGEVAEDANRGMLQSFMNIFIALGNLLPYVIGPYTSVLVFNLILAAFPAVFLVAFYAVAPETPYLFVKKGDVKTAEAALMRLRSEGAKGVCGELQKIKETVEEDQEGSLRDLFGTGSGRRSFLLSVALIAFQQFSGVNAIIFYTEIIFAAAGSTIIPPEIASISLGSIQVLASLIAPFLVDRLGRRPLLIISGLGMSLSMGLLATFFYLKEETAFNVETIFWLPVLSLGAFIVTFNVGFGPLPWCVAGEIFPSNVKAMAISLTTTACWICGFLVSKYFIVLSATIGYYGCFTIFTAVSVFGSFFVLFWLPETRGKSFSEIHALFR